MALNYLILTFFWVIYFFTHSYFADQKVKEKFRRSFPGIYPYYRLIYNFFAVVLLIPSVYWMAAVDFPEVWAATLQVKFLGVVLAGGGALIIINAFTTYSLKEFVGVHLTDRMENGLRTTGVFGWVRHPVYLGTLMFFAGFILWNPTTGNILTYLLVWVYLVIGIKLEEKKLVEEFGEDYLKYQQEVPGLLPLSIFNKRKVS